MLLTEVAEVSQTVTATSARLAKIAAIANALRSADAGEAAIVVAWLSGELPQRQIGIGYAALRTAPPPAAAASLTVLGVDDTLTRIKSVAGKGAVAERKRLLAELLGAATAREQPFLIRLLSGELRQGALDGVMTEAVARASEVPAGLVRRAVMVRGSLPAVAAAALGGGASALAEFGLRVGQPLKPMLASSAPSIADALAKIAGTSRAADQETADPETADQETADPEATDPEAAALGTNPAAAVEWKLDGIRIQAHLAAGSVRLFTRTLDDITARLPEVVATLAALPVKSAVFDGELIALRADGRPLPFQDTSARVASDSAAASRNPVELSLFFFDVLHLDGTDLIDDPDQERRAALARVVPGEMLMPRLVTADADEATAFYADAVARGHEGVVVKALDAPYAAGRRGAGWIKVKPRHTLDLVVLGVEWGSGRRKGWLSNLHLGARDAESGGWVMLGKTFKGLTDELLAWQTARLLELEDHRDDWTVYVRPELVVEIAFDGVQRSPRYPGGVALRFARVLRYREDKPAAEADTIETVRALSQALGDEPPPAA
jgi:ATP-dependent DNA ligase I